MSVNVYDYQIDLNGDSAPARIIRLCGQGQRVLEIGAGPGSISRILVEQKKCNVVCVERDETSLEALRTFCPSVYKADLNDEDWAKVLNGEDLFDIIIVADVLEHLYDPWSTLANLKSLLRASGNVLLSIPHSGHRALLAALSAGNFAYRDWGLLDRTHIRFFGMTDIQELIDKAGFSIKEADFVVRTPDAMELSAVWNSTPAGLREAYSQIKFGDVYQVVARLELSQSASSPVDLREIAVKLPVDTPTPVKLIAFYLPQFHPVEQNDVWWGKGFTEWTNVTKAKPHFHNHYQPHLPGELGFYDLRLKESRIEQINLAKRFGIDGFCYHFYWFSGERILEKPLEDMLSDPDIDMPFCLCWANENWTRRWDGQNQEVLLSQKYFPGDDERFIRDILPYIRDSRYIRYNGRPILVVYYPQDLPNPVASARTWRQICADEGLGELYLVAAAVFGNTEYEKFGFDALVEFPPHNLKCQNFRSEITELQEISYVPEYSDMAKECLDRKYWPYGGYNGFRTVVPSWDNTARTGPRGTAFLNGTPENYEFWLDQAIRKTREDNKQGDRLVFINAWNEWAEGCHLEPDRKYGRKFLEATLRAKSGTTEVNSFQHIGRDPYRDPDALAKADALRLAKAERDEFEEKYRAKSKEVQRYEQSLSWKATAPLRDLFRHLGGKK